MPGADGPIEFLRWMDRFLTTGKHGPDERNGDDRSTLHEINPGMLALMPLAVEGLLSLIRISLRGNRDVGDECNINDIFLVALRTGHVE